MAEEEEQAEEQVEEGTEEEGSKKKLFIIIGAVLVVIIAAGAGAWLWMSSGEKDEEPGMKMAKSQEALSKPQILPQGFEEEDEFAEDEEPLGAIYPMEAFIINLADGSRYLRVEIQLEFTEREVPRRFMGRLVPIRDLLIKLLTSRSAKELSSNDGKEELRDDLHYKNNENILPLILVMEEGFMSCCPEEKDQIPTASKWIWYGLRYVVPSDASTWNPSIISISQPLTWSNLFLNIWICYFFYKACV